MEANTAPSKKLGRDITSFLHNKRKHESNSSETEFLNVHLGFEYWMVLFLFYLICIREPFSPIKKTNKTPSTHILEIQIY